MIAEAEAEHEQAQEQEKSSATAISITKLAHRDQTDLKALAKQTPVLLAVSGPPREQGACGA